MRLLIQLAAVVALMLLERTVMAQTGPLSAARPLAGDIPKPKPVDLSSIGSAEQDVARFLLARAPRAGRLSPDGGSLVFIANITGRPQLWVVDRMAGTPKQLTSGVSVNAFQWAPDGSRIVYSADRGGDERFGIYTITPDGRQAAELVPSRSTFATFGDFANAGQDFAYGYESSDGLSFDTWLVPPHGGAPRKVFRGREGLYPTLGNPYNTLIAMTEARGEDANDLSSIDTLSGREQVLRRPSEPSLNKPVAWTPDGQSLYVITNEDREFNALAKLSLASGAPSLVEAPPHDIVGADLSADGRYLAWVTEANGFESVHARDLRTGRMLATPELPSGAASVHFARGVALLAISIAGPRTPGEVWAWDLTTGHARLVVKPDSAGLDLASMVVPSAVEFKARDGVPLSGLLYRPTRHTGRAPVFLHLHGGPSNHARAGWEPFLQYLVAHGIAVLDFNYRGSTGAGKSLARLNYGRLRPNEIGDLMDAVDWIRHQPTLDGTRLAVGGVSYGGYLTNAVVGKYPHLFVAAVSEVGIADWVRTLREAPPSLKANDRVEYGDIDSAADQAFFASISPINDAGQVRTPMLIESGAADTRIGVDETDAYVAAIRNGGGTVFYRRYENEGHVMTDLADMVDFNRAKAAFLEQYLGH